MDAPLLNGRRDRIGYWHLAIVIDHRAHLFESLPAGRFIAPAGKPFRSRIQITDVTMLVCGHYCIADGVERNLCTLFLFKECRFNLLELRYIGVGAHQTYRISLFVTHGDTTPEVPAVNA